MNREPGKVVKSEECKVQSAKLRSDRHTLHFALCTSHFALSSYAFARNSSATNQDSHPCLGRGCR